MALGHGKPLAPFAFFNDQKFEVADQAENQLFFNLLPFDYDGLGEENFEFVWEPLQEAVADPGIAPQYFQDDVSDFNDTETEVYDFYANAPLSDPNEVAVSRVEYPDWVDDELINDEALYPDYWAIPPPIDPNEVPFPYHDASSEPDELDTSNDDLGFALSPLADDNDVAVSRVTDATEQPVDPEDEPFEFTQDAVADAPAVQSDQVFVEDGSTNWDVEAEEPTQDFFDAPLSEDGAPPVPGPNVDYQGDGKKRKKRKNATQELFDSIERTLRQKLAGVDLEPSGIAVTTAKSAVIDVEHGIEVALKQLTEAATGHTDLSARLAQIRAEIALFEAKTREQDEDDEWMMMN